MCQRKRQHYRPTSNATSELNSDQTLKSFAAPGRRASFSRVRFLVGRSKCARPSTFLLRRHANGAARVAPLGDKSKLVLHFQEHERKRSILCRRPMAQLSVCKRRLTLNSKVMSSIKKEVVEEGVLPAPLNQRPARRVPICSVKKEPVEEAAELLPMVRCPSRLLPGSPRVAFDSAGSPDGGVTTDVLKLGCDERNYYESFAVRTHYCITPTAHTTTDQYLISFSRISQTISLC
eukprot:COSAG05_NODE_1698_length_4256_cov_26.898737_3_plen_234_part_00